MSQYKRIIVIATESERQLIPHIMPASCDVLVMGVGGTNVIQSLKTLPKSTHIINIGYAGSLYYPQGDIIKIGRTQLWHPVADYEEPKFVLGPSEDAVCYTTTDFFGVQESPEHALYDMELAYIAALGFRKVDAYKVVSDHICYDEYNEFIHKA